MILLLGGTSEARELYYRLQEEKMPCTVTVTSAYAESLLSAAPNSCVRVGKLDEEKMVGLLESTGASFLVDATHPFAVEASRNAMEAARKTGAFYLRLEREKEEIPSHPLITTLENLEELYDLSIEGKIIFSALGSKHLEQLVPVMQEKGCRLIARVLPQAKMLSKCEQWGLSASQLVALPGPFSRSLNRELFQHFGAQCLVTKESGKAGGQKEKIDAALDLGIKVALWRRPELDYPRLCHCIEEVVMYLK